MGDEDGDGDGRRQATETGDRPQYTHYRRRGAAAVGERIGVRRRGGAGGAVWAALNAGMWGFSRSRAASCLVSSPGLGLPAVCPLPPAAHSPARPPCRLFFPAAPPNDPPPKTFPRQLSPHHTFQNERQRIIPRPRRRQRWPRRRQLWRPWRRWLRYVHEREPRH